MTVFTADGPKIFRNCHVRQMHIIFQLPNKILANKNVYLQGLSSKDEEIKRSYIL